jgi:dTDP-4-dehydrorhamnose 3,5-epimerase|tara:strand:+ start:101 stop:640 length:540 start_codon:yes stop_codon:yes gene_type:complete
MKLKSTNFKGLKIIQSKIYRDSRGFFKEDFKQLYFKKKFIFGCTSRSKKNVLRGLHIQTKNSQGKHISVLKGSIYDVVVDLRKNSKTFGKYYSIILSDKNGKSISIPEGFAHGFIGLEKENIVYYFNTKYRSVGNEIGINWKDRDLKIKWPVKKPILSLKDKNNYTLKEFTKKFIKRKK